MKNNQEQLNTIKCYKAFDKDMTYITTAKANNMVKAFAKGAK